MAQKIEKARMQQKHDVASNWGNVEGFVPKAGELVIYDKDENNSKQSIKVGDGETAVGELPAITGEVYVSAREPKNAGENAVWIVPDSSQGTAQYMGDVVAYLYNGVRLPALPEWDTATYPYAYIYKIENIYYLHCFDTGLLPEYGNGELSKIYLPSKDTGSKYQIFTTILEGTQWNYEGSSTGSIFQIQRKDLIWSYKDIKNGNEIAFAATEPTPIYELEDQLKNADWSLNEKGQPGYVRNRPMWSESGTVSQSWMENLEERDFTLTRSDPTGSTVSSQTIKVKYTSNFCPRYDSTYTQGEVENVILKAITGELPYSDLSFPTLPEYNTSFYLYRLLRFVYEENSSTWKELYLYFSDEPFYYDSSNETIKGTHDVYSYNRTADTSGWGDLAVISANIEIFTIGQFERYLSNYQINVDSTSQVYLYADIPNTIDFGTELELDRGMIYLRQQELSEKRDNMQAGDSLVCVISGSAYGYSSDSYFFVKIYKDNTNEDVLGFILRATTDEDARPVGTYFVVKEENEEYLCQLDIEYKRININEKYQSIFKKQTAADIYVLDPLTLTNIIANSEIAAEELKRFKAGDILLIPQDFMSGG